MRWWTRACTCFAFLHVNVDAASLSRFFSHDNNAFRFVISRKVATEGLGVPFVLPLSLVCSCSFSHSLDATITHFNSGPSQASLVTIQRHLKGEFFEYMKGYAITMFRSVSARSDILHDCILRHV
jgi:hypothetical protein